MPMRCAGRGGRQFRRDLLFGYQVRSWNRLLVGLPDHAGFVKLGRQKAADEHGGEEESAGFSLYSGQGSELANCRKDCKEENIDHRPASDRMDDPAQVGPLPLHAKITSKYAEVDSHRVQPSSKEYRTANKVVQTAKPPLPIRAWDGEGKPPAGILLRPQDMEEINLLTNVGNDLEIR